MKNYYYYQTDLGLIGIADDGQAITDLFFAHDEKPNGASLKESELIKEAALELMQYLQGGRQDFEVPLHFDGTEMQKQVWNALMTIPYGQTRSYKQIAEQIGRPRAYRAVGMANHRNPIAIIVPCHRVIGADGSLVGYGGGLHIKTRLLDLEKRYRLSHTDKTVFIAE